MLLSVVTGALIGLVTNGLAIAMLFRPWRPWRIGRWRVPMTPGLIPRRREEIARHLGRIVEEHLLTSEGFRRAFDDPEARNRLAGGWERFLDWAGTEGIEAAVAAVVRWAQRSGDAEEGGKAEPFRFVAGREAASWAERFPDSATAARLAETAARAALDAAEEGLRDLRVRRFVADAVHRWLFQQGWVGRLAGALGAEERVADELIRATREWLRGEEARAAATEWIRRTVLPEGARRVADLLRDPERLERWLAGLRDACGDAEWVRDRLIRGWSWLQAHRSLWEPELRERLMRIAESGAPHVWRYVPVARIVEDQVNRFPLPHLERLVLDTARRELAMITWMGGVLGALIALGQVLIAAGR